MSYGKQDIRGAWRSVEANLPPTKPAPLPPGPWRLLVKRINKIVAKRGSKRVASLDRSGRRAAFVVHDGHRLADRIRIDSPRAVSRLCKAMHVKVATVNSGPVPEMDNSPLVKPRPPRRKRIIPAEPSPIGADCWSGMRW